MINFFKKKTDALKNFKKIELAVCSLLIHAAKLDGCYEDIEKITIKKCLKKLGLKEDKYIEALFNESEKLEQDSIQILEMTKEIKKLNYENRLEIIEMLLTTIYSDKNIHHYENNLVRRVAGLIYIEDFHVGEIKRKFK